MKIIPAIDILDGKCVRLSKGDYRRKTEYGTTPLEMAKRFEGVGIERLHLVDLNGARSGVVQNLPVLEKLVCQTKLRIDFSGGVRTRRTVSAVFEAGASFLAIGSAAVLSPAQVSNWFRSFGVDRFILGADVRGRELAVSGWTDDTGIEIVPFVSHWRRKGVGAFLCTSIEKDGLLSGPDFSLYTDLERHFPETLFIVSGGISSVSDLRKLKEQGAKEVIIGKALYEGRISLEDLRAMIC